MSIEAELKALAEKEAAAEAIWDAGKRVFDVGRDADFVQKDNPHAMRWQGFGGLPVSVNTPADGRTGYKEGTFDGHKVRDYGDGTYSTWKHGIRLVHNERSRRIHGEQTGASSD